ncbi:NAD(P)H-dependent flavin oxidoreductase [Marinobacter sp. 1Y8]
MVTPTQALYTPLCEQLGCRYPILLAGMGGVSRHRLAAAVSNAGGYGVLGMVRESVDRLRYEVNALRELTDAPFAVNLIPAATGSQLLTDQINTCRELNVRTLVFFWDVDDALVRSVRKDGFQVIHQVGSEQVAEQALAAGVDALIVQGHEAGGHVHGTTATLSLLRPVVAMSDVPVVASGGIASGEAIAAALLMGAQGVSLGSAFLTTHEANVHTHHKQRIVQARVDDTRYTTRFSRNWPIAAPVRVLENAVTRGECDDAGNDVILGAQDDEPVYLFSTDSPLADATGRVDDMALYCGQSCGQISDVVSVDDRMAGLVQHAIRCTRA